MKKLLLAALLSLASLGSWAAITTNAVVLPQTPNRGIAQLTTAPGTYITLYTAGSNGSICYGMVATNSDPALHLVTVQLTNAGVNYGGTAASVALTAGFVAANLPVSLMSAAAWPGLPVSSDGNPYITLISGDTLRVTYTTALTSGVINVYVSCADF